MDEKNAYTELVKQNRAKHRAKLKASKEIKKLEQKKEKVILKYEQAAKDNTCITFHQYCRKKWASEAGIESVPDDDETDVEWQEKLNAKQKEDVSKLFKNATDMTPQEYRLSFRMNKAKELLKDSSISVQNVAYSVGYNDPFSFSKFFKRETGLSPSEYRKKNL